MHSRLSQQLELMLTDDAPPSGVWWRRFIAQVSAAYHETDAELQELRRALAESEQGREEQAARLRHELEQRTEFEQALADSRAELHEVLAAMPDQVWLVESDGSLTDPRPRLPTPETDELMAALRDSGELENACARARLTDALVKWEFPATVSGQLGLYEARCVPHRNSQGIVLVRDMTELRSTQQQLALSEQMASVGVMASGVAHEVNSPLTAVMSNLAHLAEELERLAPGQHAELDLLAVTLEAKRGAERIRDVVRDLAGFAASDHQAPRPCDINQLIDDALVLVAHEIRHRASLTRLRGDLPELVADGARLTQAFVNLLMHAAQSIEVGRAQEHRILVETTARDGSITIRFQDTGAGLLVEPAPLGLQPSVPQAEGGQLGLQPSVPQAEGAQLGLQPSVPQAEGAQLGLSIARKIVEEHGGSVEVRAEPGVGTEVLLKLPIEAPHPGAQAEPPRESTKLGAQLARVLIIDDEADVGRAMRRALTGQHHITLARSGLEALALLKEEPFDLIICDLMMPEMSGMELFEHALRRHPEQAERFVFMTGGAFSDAGRRFLSQLTTEYLRKPFDQAHLRAFMALHLARLRQGR